MASEDDTVDPGFSGTVRCPAEHAGACRYVCDQLGGRLSVNPDDSLTCDFTLPTSSTPVLRAPGSFEVNESQAVAGRSICSQLGGKFIVTDAGGRCEFLLPQEPRWSIQPLSHNAAVVRFDTDTFYTVAATATGVALTTIHGGTVIERIELVQSRSDGTVTVIAVGTDGATSKLQASMRRDRISLSYSVRNQAVFEHEGTVMSAVNAFTTEYARSSSELYPQLPYARLLLEEVNRSPLLGSNIARFLGPGVRSDPSVVGPIDFCQFACSICWASGGAEVHACIACIFCNSFSAAPPRT